MIFHLRDAGAGGIPFPFEFLLTNFQTVKKQVRRLKELEACQRAISLDPNNAEAHALRGMVRFYFDRDAKAAESDFRRSRELDPRYAQGRQFHSFMLLSLGRTEEAIQEAKAGRDLEPLSLVQNANVAYALNSARRYDEAIEWCRRTLVMDPNFLRARYILGVAYERKKMYPEAVAELETARRLSESGPFYVACLGHAYAAAGRTTDARRCLEDLNGTAQRRFVGADQIALVHAGLGEREAALTLLEKAEEERDVEVMNIGFDSRWDLLRSDPRFQQLMRRLNMPPAAAQ
jgi:tetratricopeptide (TPR) repeat protein